MANQKENPMGTAGRKWIAVAVLVAVCGIGVYIWKPARGTVVKLSSGAPVLGGAEQSGLSAEAAVAVDRLRELPDVKRIESAIAGSGEKTFYTEEGKEGDVVSVSLREAFVEDEHTTRIDTFNVNLKTGEITVDDVAENTKIPLDQWRTEAGERFAGTATGSGN